MLTVNAPAKMNLTLEVLGKRPDGFHEIRSIIQTINLCDTIRFENSRDVSIECDMPEWSADKSLVSQAVALMRETSGQALGVKLDIKKSIPMMSGLGGDSSDAAAVLKGLNELWGLDLSHEKLCDFAGQLGSDVFFFLHGGTALVEGRGDKVTSLPSFPGKWVVLVVPDVPAKAGKTAGMYAGLRDSHYTDGSITRKLAETLHKSNAFDTSFLFNAFENIAFEDNAIRTYKEHLEKLGAPHVHMCGSGPALFTMFKEKSSAEEMYTCCKNQGMQVCLVVSL